MMVPSSPTANGAFDFQLDLVDIYSRELQGSIVGAAPEGIQSSRRLIPLLSVVREARGDANATIVDACRCLVQGRWEELETMLIEWAEATDAGRAGSSDVLDADDVIIQALEELVAIRTEQMQQAAAAAAAAASAANENDNATATATPPPTAAKVAEGWVSPFAGTGSP